MNALTYILIPYFLLGSLMPRSDFGQFEYFDDMRDHYQLHLEEAIEQNQSFSVWDFIYLHFLSPDEHAHDDHGEDHRHLPLHIIHTSINLITTVGLDIAELDHDPDQNGIYKNVFHLEGFLTGVFHPPFSLN